MAKKKILYPVIKETTYWEHDYYDPELIGKPREVKGSLLNYIDNYSLFCFEKGEVPDSYKNVELIENKVFPAVLTYDHVERGRSACTFIFKSQDGAEYPMFLKDMDTILKTKDFSSGEVSGVWTFTKRGANYGIKLAE